MAHHLRIVVAVVCLLSGLLSSYAALAQTQTTPSKERQPPITSATPGQGPSEESWDWVREHIPLNEGCYTSSYPNEAWQKTPCVRAPKRPYLPVGGPRPAQVGNSNSPSATASAPIYSAIGSFDSVTGVTSENGQVNNTGPSVPDAFSLQLNTQTFHQTPLCSGRPIGCAGWQQFVYINDCGGGGCVFIQYWLLNYGQPCPDTSWIPNSGSCYKNSNAAPVGRQVIQNLSTMSLNGNATPGSNDTVIFYSGAFYMVIAPDSLLNLGQYWQLAEFNVFGDGGGGQANFNAGSTIIVRLGVSSGSATAPTCGSNGFTGETNNLFFVAAGTPPSSGRLPAIVFTESSTPSATLPCDAVSPVVATAFNFNHVVYSYCIGESINVPGSTCNYIQKPFGCYYNSQDFRLGEGVCYDSNYAFFKTIRTGTPAGGNQCGYSYGLMFCTNSDDPDRLCSAIDNTYGCVAGPVNYPRSIK